MQSADLGVRVAEKAGEDYPPIARIDANLATKRHRANADCGMDKVSSFKCSVFSFKSAIGN